MGKFDTIIVNCPNCGEEFDVQAKSGKCFCDWSLEEVPTDILKTANRHAPFLCKSCSCKFMIDITRREVIELVPGKKSVDNYKLAFDKCYNALCDICISLYLEKLLPHKMDERITLLSSKVDFTQHVLWMCNEALSFKDDSKKDRWLGFVQGYLWANGVASINEMKDWNKGLNK